MLLLPSLLFFILVEVQSTYTYRPNLLMGCGISRFYICTDREENEGYVIDLVTEDAEEYEEKLKAEDTDYLRVDQ